MYKNEINKLFENFCCSDCRYDFNYDAVKVKREEKGLIVMEIICPKCGKNFGIALLAFDKKKVEENETPLDFIP